VALMEKVLQPSIGAKTLRLARREELGKICSHVRRSLLGIRFPPEAAGEGERGGGTRQYCSCGLKRDQQSHPPKLTGEFWPEPAGEREKERFNWFPPTKPFLLPGGKAKEPEMRSNCTSFQQVQSADPIKDNCLE